MKKSVLITGVSSGIGYSLLKNYVGRGYEVFGSVRKEADQSRLESEFPGVKILRFDVADEEAIRASVPEVEAALGGRGLSLLINNAGIAVSGPLMLMDTEEFQRQFDINVFGVLRVTKAFLPLLGAVENPGHPPGKIMNVSSLAGGIAFPFTSAYASSKHALEGLSHGLRRELYPFGIDVIILGPGSIKTPIWEKESATVIPEKYRKSIFGKYVMNFQKVMQLTGASGLDPDQFAKRVADISEKKKPKARYAFAPNYLKDWWIPRYLLPHRTLDKAVHKMLSYTKPSK